MNLIHQAVRRTRPKEGMLGTNLRQLVREYLQKLAGGDHPERSIEEFKRLSGRGHSSTERFDRNEIHERS